jgi:regulator of cell morphogenesis and NO signaling
MEKVAVRHGENNPNLIDLKFLFQELSGDLSVHLKKEEFILFRYINEMEKSEIIGVKVTKPHFEKVKNPVRMMTDEHDTSGDILRKMQEVTNSYTLPEGACPSFQALYQRLQELQADLHEHIHLENNLLFPRAIELELRIFG